jgi:hypothetical protein
MAEERLVTLDLGDGVKMVVAAEQKGPELVSEDKLIAKLGVVTDSIERVGRGVLNAARKAQPSKASVELGFSLAIEQGQLVALLGKGRGEASIKVTLEWAGSKDGTGEAG